MNPLHSAPFLRAYPLFPHGALNRAAGWLSRARRPRFAVDAAVRLWIRRARIDMSEFAPGPFATVEEFFLRRLRPGARPLAAEPGWVSPVDGHVMASGALGGDAEDDHAPRLLVKGQLLSLDRLVNGVGAPAPISIEPYRGGAYLVLFLSPRGYHYVHWPVAATADLCQWLPGRYFPQNEAALRLLRAVYERNERLVLRCHTAQPPGVGGHPFLMILVGASLVGGIHLRDLPRPAFTRAAPTPCQLSGERGAELGHFAFGSTVVLLFPRGSAPPLPPIGADLRMGQRLG